MKALCVVRPTPDDGAHVVLHVEHGMVTGEPPFHFDSKPLGASIYRAYGVPAGTAHRIPAHFDRLVTEAS